MAPGDVLATRRDRQQQGFHHKGDGLHTTLPGSPTGYTAGPSKDHHRPSTSLAIPYEGEVHVHHTTGVGLLLNSYERSTASAGINQLKDQSVHILSWEVAIGCQCSAIESVMCVRENLNTRACKFKCSAWVSCSFEQHSPGTYLKKRVPKTASSYLQRFLVCAAKPDACWGSPTSTIHSQFGPL